MEPFFFGRNNHLFGIFHPNMSAESRGAILVAPPLLTETIRTHYALKEISVGLSKVGFDVLRFDFSGCGDSAGDLREITVEHWVEDLREAAEELKALTGETQVSSFSARFSSALVALLSARMRWKSTVLWDPLLSGKNWIEQLEYVRSLLLNHQLTDSHEYLGELTSPGFTESLAAIDAAQISAMRVVAIVTDDQSQVDPQWESRKLSFDSAWRRPFTENLFSHLVISETVSILTE